jgi:hypothetical protein
MPGNAVFINYRRADSSGHAGRLRDHLVTRFGHDRVFMDVGILGGEDWVASIERALSTSGVVLTIIGPNWGSSRMQDPGDRLRQELEAAMGLGVQIIPVLVGGARMPDEGDLPSSLRNLPRHQAVRLTDDGWEDDVRRLTGRLVQLVGPRQGGVDGTRPSLVARLVSTLIVLTIVAGTGFLIYRFAIDSPAGGNGFPDKPDPKITLSPGSGPPGTTVTVTGTGFPANSDIELWLLGPVAETVSDGSGSFSASFEVPGTPFGGIQDVLASGGAFSDSAQFTIEGVD